MSRKRPDKETANAYARAWRERNPEKYKATQARFRLKRNYGLSEEDYSGLIADQGGKCKLCGLLFGETKETRPNVDHDHLTGAVRGILCIKCNVGIGALGDSVEGLERALRYLRGVV